MKLTNTFLSGTMNLDINPRLMPKNQYGFAKNIEIGNHKQDVDYVDGSGNLYPGAGQARVGAVRPTRGNAIPINKFNASLLITASAGGALVNARCIGACADQATNSVYFLITSTHEDMVVMYTDLPDTISASGSQGNVGTIRYILRAPKPIDPIAPGRFLNFDPKFIVTGINYFNGYLMWTDNLNPPRMIKVDNFLGLTLNPASGAPIATAWNQDDINVIVKPPMRSPRIFTYNDGSEKNYMKDKFLYFSYRFKYTDGRWSSIAPFSIVAFRPSVFVYNAHTGTNEGMSNRHNVCDITVDTGDRQVTDIQLLFKDSEFSNVYIIETINKKNPIVGVSPIPNNSTWKFRDFDNGKIYSTLPSNQLTRLFDNVPIRALAQDIIGSRLVYGNYVQFYNMKNSYNGKIVPNYTVTVKSAPMSVTEVHASMKTNRDYQVGFLYSDDYGRMSTVITSIHDTTNVPQSLSGKRNWLELKVAHYPPSWATKYRLAIRQNREKYYNIYPISVFIDGNYSWFRLSNSDKDKVNEGDYVVIKSDYGGINYTGKEHKVVELKYLTPTSNPEGLYIKLAYIPSSTSATINTFSPSNANGVLSSSPTTSSWLTGATTSSDYSPIILYPQAGVSYKLAASEASYSRLTYPSRDWRFILEYVGTNAAGSHLLTYRPHDGSLATSAPTIFRTAAGAPVGVPILEGGITRGTLTISPSLVFSIGDTMRLNIFSVATGRTIANERISRLSLVIDSKPDEVIYAGSEIKIQIEEVTGVWSILTATYVYSTTSQSQQMSFISQSQYVDIQEWYYEDQIYNNFYQSPTVGSKYVFFRYASSSSLSIVPGTPITQRQIQLAGGSSSGKVYMLITTSMDMTSPSLRVYAMYATDGVRGLFKITYQSNFFCLETIPKQNENSVFHECTEDLDIVTSGAYKFHGGNMHNQTAGAPAIISLDLNLYTSGNPITNRSFNCWAFPNGVESDRIRDDFNAPTMEWSPRVLVPVEEYKEDHAYAGLTYSGTFNFDSPANNLNQFNLSIGNFKQLDKSFGSVQKIRSRDTDIVVFQQDKVSKVLFGKNLLSDSSGGGQITSVPEVLGTQIAYEGQFGISNNPESFAQWGDDMYFTDSQRGAVLRLNNQGLYDISNKGMKSFFNYQFKLQPDTIKIGVFDPFFKRYFLSETDISKKNMTTTVTNPIDATPAAAYALMATTTVGTISS